MPATNEARSDTASVRKLIKPSTLAEQWDLDVSTITRWCREGRLPAYRLFGGDWRIDESKLDAVLQEGAA
jgi:excisionase family DNA binding protein